MKMTSIETSALQTPLTVVYDGKDSAAAHEVKFLKTRNRDNKLLFIDIAYSPDSATQYAIGVSVNDTKIVVHDAAGHVYSGNDALYAAHEALGLGFWFEMCRLPGFMSVGTGIGPKK